MNDTKYFKILQSSPIIFSIRKTASKIFLVYKESVENQYPNYSFSEKTDTVIKDIEECFVSGLKKLFEKEHEKKTILGWSEGFMIGFVSSSLYSRWQSKYIYLRTKTYEQLMLLKAISLYLKFDNLTIDRIEKLYNYLMDSNQSIQIDDSTENKNVIFLKKHQNKKYKDKFDEEFKNSTVNYLESIILKKHHSAFNKIVANKNSFTIEHFYSIDEISNLITTCKEKLKTT